MKNIELLEQQASKLQQDLDKLKETISKEKNNTKDINYIINSTSDKQAVKRSLEILGETRDTEGYEFEDNQDMANCYLKIIIKAVNFLDNNNEIWIPDYSKNNNEYKYEPYFDIPGGGLVVLVCLADPYCDSATPVAFQYKNKQSGELIVKNFINLYTKWIRG